MRLARSILLLLIGIGLASTARPAAAVDHVIGIGGSWPAASAVSPGDRILLEPGLHPPHRLSGYRGTPEAPIVITARSTEVPTGIGSDETGGWSLRIEECDHLIVRSLLVMCAGVGGVEIQGPAEGRGGTIGLVDLQLLPADPAALPAEGVVARGLERTTIVGVRVRGWISNAVRIENTRLADVRLLVNDGSVDEATCRTGLRVAGTDRIILDSCSFIGLTEAAVRLDTDKTEDAVSLRIARSVFFRTATPLHLETRPGSRVNAALIANTLVEPRRLIEIEEVGGSKTSTARTSVQASVDRCLVTWTVGGLKEIAKADVDTLDLTLGPNLWASNEADIIFGGGVPFTGNQSVKQVLQVDVDLDPRTLLPRSGPSLDFGHGFRPDNPSGPE